MIRITQIIEHLRQNLPTWSVDGAVNLALAEDASRLPLPGMYVGLAPIVYTDVSTSTYLQDYVETFFIMTCTPLSPENDRTGKYAQDFVPLARESLFQLLVNNKQFDPDSHVIMMARDLPEKIDRARYYHRFEFRIKGRIGPEDVTPLQLDYFDKLFAEYVVQPDATDATPPIEQEISPIYFTTDT